MKIIDTEIELSRILEAQQQACKPAKSDHQLAREYAEMMEAVILDADELNESENAPSRRFYRHDKEAWVYDHGNIVELVFVGRDK